jgi:3-hydroxyisobutyrate dehydrogenase-like beta-hydroxyacid dehydrogenase
MSAKLQGENMRVGFIGLGNMGAPIAANLLKAGHELTVHNRTPAKAQALVGQGAGYASSVAEACRGDVVFTMLSDDSALEAVVFGDSGILQMLKRDGIHISASTISVALSDKLEAAHAQHGQKIRCGSRVRPTGSRCCREALCGCGW